MTFLILHHLLHRVSDYYVRLSADYSLQVYRCGNIVNFEQHGEPLAQLRYYNSTAELFLQKDGYTQSTPVLSCKIADSIIGLQDYIPKDAIDMLTRNKPRFIKLRRKIRNIIRTCT